MMRRLLLAAGLVLGLVQVPNAQAAVTDCTEAGLRTAIAAGGTVTLSCATSPTTITIASEILIRNDVTIDGGGTVTLRGAGNNRLFHQQSWGTASSSVTLRNLTISNGRAVGSAEAANGGAILSENRSAGQSYPVTLTIANVTFTDNDTNVTGYPDGQGLNAYDFGGGAIFTTGGYLRISASRFSSNDAANGAGGAIHILQSSVTIASSSFSANSAIGKTAADSLGGAIYVDGMKDDAGELAISASTFSGNTSYNSGGAIHVNMYQNANRFSVVDSSFSNNAIVGGNRAQGGAIGGGSTAYGPNSGNASISISRSYFGGNSVQKSGTPTDGSGGALAFPQRARISIADSSFSGNRAYGSSYNANGGAVYIVNNTDPFTIVGSTFANNRAGWVGGAVSNSEINSGPGGSVSRSIFANNTADNGGNPWQIQQHCSSELTDSGGNLQYPARNPSGNYSNEVTCFVGKSAVAQRTLPEFRDPQLLAAADNGGPTLTLAFGGGSPALDNGGACSGTDQRGITRPQGAACDSGAFELVQRLSASPALLGPTDAGGTLTITGAGFSSGSQVLWDGLPLVTTFVNANTLRAALPATLGAPRSVSVTVSGSALPAVAVRVTAQIYRVYLAGVNRS